MLTRYAYVIQRDSDGLFLKPESHLSPRFVLFTKARIFNKPHHASYQLKEVGEGHTLRCITMTLED